MPRPTVLSRRVLLGRAMGVVGLLVTGAGTLAANRAAQAHSLKELEDELYARERYLQVVNAPAPDFALLDTDGRAVGLSDLRGKVVVLNFIYASCPDVCPVHTEYLARIQEMVNATPMRDLVRFVTITTDPERDTPAVLKDYVAAHGLDPTNWLFLTSGTDEPAATRELAQRFGLEFTLTGDGYQMHGVVTHLIDKSGVLRARYHGMKPHPTNLVVHINALTNDFH